MPYATRTRAAKKAAHVSSTRLAKDDLRDVRSLVTATKKTEAHVLRELVHEALKTRRLRRAGRDETTAPVRDAQREIVRDELADLKAQFKGLIEQQDCISRMLEDLQQGLAPLIFELVFEAWTDGRMTREVVLRNLLLPKFSDADRGSKSEQELLAELLGKAQATSRRKAAEIRRKITENPFDSRRYASS
jgi:hypothetical protein